MPNSLGSDSLPSDFYRPQSDLTTAWKENSQQRTSPSARRIDLVFAVYTEELRAGPRGVLDRVLQRLQAESTSKSSKTAVCDLISIFRTFRLEGEAGLGYTLAELEGIAIRKLRAVAQ